MYLIENVVTESDHIHNYTIEVRQRSFPFEIFKLCTFCSQRKIMSMLTLTRLFKLK